MGVFSFFKKEAHINKLAEIYRGVYGVGRMDAIMALRSNYTEGELKNIIDRCDREGHKTMTLGEWASMNLFK